MPFGISTHPTPGIISRTNAEEVMIHARSPDCMFQDPVAGQLRKQSNGQKVIFLIRGERGEREEGGRGTDSVVKVEVISQ